jgi:metal-responsive CopG/Arc/MetJ family transcriptional regulator
MAVARTNMTLPEELLAEIDAIAGPRGRSRYVAEAVTQRLRRDKLGRAIASTAGVMTRGGTGMTRKEVSAWVERLRAERSE